MWAAIHVEEFAVMGFVHSPYTWIAVSLGFLALETLIWRRIFLWLFLVSAAIGVASFYLVLPSPEVAGGVAAAAALGYLGRSKRMPKRLVKPQSEVALGTPGTLTETIRGKGQSGAVMINGKVWIASADERITVGQPVIVIGVNQQRLRVKANPS